MYREGHTLTTKTKGAGLKRRNLPALQTQIGLSPNQEEKQGHLLFLPFSIKLKAMLMVLSSAPLLQGWPSHVLDRVSFIT